MAFDYKKHLIKVQGNKLYLPVAARVVWFRETHPDWGIHTEIVELNHEKQYSIFRASIFNSEGKLIAMGTKKEDIKGFGDYMEKSECVPLDTQILTRGGWQFWSELTDGQDVLSYDVKTDTSEWVPLQRVVTYQDAEVVRVSNGWGFDAVCTPEHTWAVTSHQVANGKRYEYKQLRKTKDFNTVGTVVTACVAPGGSSLVTKEQAAIMGWLITDGGFHRNANCLRGMIYQSKGAQVSQIEKLLLDAGLSCHHTIGGGRIQTMPNGNDYDCLPSHRWHINAGDMRTLYAAFQINHEECLQHSVASLSVEARKAMLAAMMAADGSKQGDFGKKRRPWVMHLFSLLCALEGIALSKTRYIMDGTFPIQRLKKTRHTYTSNLKVEDAGTSDVWCPTTKHGTWYARFANGFTTITGNSGAIGRALTMCGFGTPFEDDLNEGERFADSPRAYNNSGNNNNGGNNQGGGYGQGGNRGGQGGGYNNAPTNNALTNRPAPVTRPANAVVATPAAEPVAAEASPDKDARVAIKQECGELLKALSPERKAYYKESIPARYGSPLSSASFAIADAKSLLSYLTYESKSGNKADLTADPFADGPDTDDAAKGNN